jgi:Apea-like HEPN
MHDPAKTKSARYIAITPLYDFKSDSQELQLNPVFRLQKHDRGLLPLAANDPLIKSLSFLEPNYLLFQENVGCSYDLGQLFEENGRVAPEQVEASRNRVVAVFTAFSEMFYLPCIHLFRLLRLFRPGTLRGGDTFVIFCGVDEDDDWTTLGSHRCSRTPIEHGSEVFPSEFPYSLNVDDIPSFAAFYDQLYPVMKSLRSTFEAQPVWVDLALDLYAHEQSESEDIVNMLTAFETLLLGGTTTTELTYRLSMRIAHLLGKDAQSRRKLFREMREFYDLRSKIVHGSELKPKHFAGLEQVAQLREILRRVLLTEIALLSEGITRQDVEVLLDDIIFDEATREQVQKIASKFFYCEPIQSPTVQ